MFDDRFFLTVIALIGIIAIALIYDAEYLTMALGLLMGIVGGYGIARQQTEKTTEEKA